MTRINTNVSSLLAQNALNQTNQSLQTALTRLSTGLRINTAADDPAGLIASDSLGSEIASTQQAVSNTQQADQMISTADSALTQVTTLLTNIRGLISAAANTGTMSADQIQANQQQIDASLNAIDQISQTTQFQGQNLLDGSLGFVTQNVNPSQISNLNVNQANFGTQNSIDVAADVVKQATQASLTYNQGPTTNPLALQIGGANGYQTFNFAAGTSVADMVSAINLDSQATGVQASGSLTTTAAQTGQTILSGTNGGGILAQANAAGKSAGNVSFVYNTAAGNAANSAVESNGVMTVTLKTSAWAAATAAAGVDLDNGGGDGATISIAANVAGTQFNGTTLVITDNAGATPDSATYNYATNTITASMNVSVGNETDTDLQNLINTQLGSLFTASGAAGDAVAVTAGVAVTNSDGTNGGTLDASDTYATIANLITHATGSTVTAKAVGTTTGLVTPFTQNATYGSVNAGLPSDMNNGIQFLGGDNASTLPITFVNSGDNQTLGVGLTASNAATGGYSTAYIQGGAPGSAIQVAAQTQGTQYDGIKVIYQQNATGDTSVVYDAAAKTITVNDDFDNVNGGGAITATDVVNQINDALGGAGGLFTASVVGSGGGGDVTAGLSGTTSGGNLNTGIVVNLGTDANGNITSTAADVINAINASTQLQALGISASNLGTSNGSGLVTVGSTSFAPAGVTQTNGYASGTTINQGGTNARMTVTATNAGSQDNNVGVVFVNDVTTPGDEYANYDAATNQLQIHIDSGVSTLNDVLNNFNATTSPTAAGLFTLALAAGSNGTGVLYATDTGTLTGGVTNAGTATGGVALAGNFDANQVIGSGMTLTSTGYGSDQFVSANAVQGSFQTTNSAGQTAGRDTGSDVKVLINGIQAVGNGLQASINNPNLSLGFNVGSTVAAGSTLKFNIIGGGALFQIGPDVTSAQQVRIGINNVSTASLGGSSGLLYQLQSGGTMSLINNVDGAAQICDQAISQVADMTGRLGAFQSTTLDTNANALTSTLANLTSAKSNITDADFAAETAALEQAQILQQSGLTVLSVANAAPKQILTLLQNL
jgi:flagellin-like hook-associated protein FlgL